MERERALLATAAVLLAGTLLAAVVTPDVLADPTARYEEPARLELVELPIRPVAVGGETATLRVEGRVRHDGGTAENVTVRYRATNVRTGFVEDTSVVDLGSVENDREHTVPANLTVPRAGDYRIEAVVFVDDRRVDAGSRTVRGLDGLTPAYARSAVSVHEFDAGIPAVQFEVEATDGNRTRLNVSTYLTNAGDTPADSLRVVVTARQAESNVVADRRTVTVESLPPGRTEPVYATVDVPSNYNYYLDVVLWRDGVVVDTTRSAANLDPTETIAVNQTRRTVRLNASEFERPPERTPRETASGGQPGFGVALAAVALLAGALFRRRGP